MRQYIGARYVPKYADPILHDPTRSYEAFEIVQNAIGDSFTSKKPVPVGIALTNTSYWVNTGNFNSQLALVENRVAELERAANKKYIFVGDSFMTGYIDGVTYNTGFAELACGVLGLTIGTDAFIAAQDGAGFNNGQLLTKLTSIYSTIPDPDAITDIYVIAGTNDVGQNPTSEIATFITYCRTAYPNAEISLGYDTFQLTGYTNDTLVRSTRAYYIKACATNGVRYLPGFAWCLDETCRTGYGYHPDTTGQDRLAQCLIEYLTNGNYEEHNSMMIPYTPLAVSGYEPQLRSTINQGVATLSSEYQSWIAEGFTAVAGSIWVKIGAINSGNIRSVPTFVVNSLVKFSDNTTQYIPFNMRIKNNDVEISVIKQAETVANIVSVTFGAFTVTYDR